MSLPSPLYVGNNAEIWHADSLDPVHFEMVMSGRKSDATIFDAPYSEKCHEGHAEGKLTADRAASFAAAHANNSTAESRYSARKSEAGESGRRDIDYSFFTPEDCKNFSDIWIPNTVGWAVSITDNILAPEWEKSFESHERYVFAPLPLVETGSRVRMTGDGPACWTCWLVVARPKNREFASWGALRGAYVQAAERKINSKYGTDRIVGGKPLQSMLDIVGDYSKPGDLVVDPFCGAATTGIACLRSGRRFIGIEKDPERAKISAEIIEAETKLTSRRALLSGQTSLW